MNILENIIKDEIHASGPISFDRFMQLALYHPEHGYYTSGKLEIGKRGDFYTSPHVHSSFGKIISNFIASAFKSIGAKELTILELGAGKGFLATDILSALTDNSDIKEKINYIVVEPSTANLSSLGAEIRDYVKIYNDISELHTINPGFVISNEMFDSLPFHRIIYLDNRYFELYVGLDGTNLIDQVGEISNAEILNYINRYELNPVNSKQLEVNLNAGKALKEIGNVLQSGYILTIDYGFLFDELFKNDRIEGTYKCFYRHTTNNNPYKNIGLQDITADIDFSNLIHTGGEIGFEKVIYTTQGQFLVDWGIIDLIEEHSSLQNHDEVNALKTLFLPGLMGDSFKALLQSKNVVNKKFNYPESKLKVSFGLR